MDYAQLDQDQLNQLQQAESKLNSQQRDLKEKLILLAVNLQK